jgi:hypothetical protein
MKTRAELIIRCGTPDCDWGFPMPDLGEVAVDGCYAAFLKHCSEMHGLTRDNASDCLMHLDLEEWTLTLRK